MTSPPPTTPATAQPRQSRPLLAPRCTAGCCGTEGRRGCVEDSKHCVTLPARQASRAGFCNSCCGCTTAPPSSSPSFLLLSPPLPAPVQPHPHSRLSRRTILMLHCTAMPRTGSVLYHSAGLVLRRIMPPLHICPTSCQHNPITHPLPHPLSHPLPLPRPLPRSLPLPLPLPHPHAHPHPHPHPHSLALTLTLTLILTLTLYLTLSHLSL